MAKCGKEKIWHWAHKSRSHCDSWWSPEGEWHKGWKEVFPDEWQEQIHTDEKTGERHIADVKTPKGLWRCSKGNEPNQDASLARAGMHIIARMYG